MASRYFNQFPGSLRFGLKYLEGTCQIGASGAVVANSFTGGGISASSTVTVQKLGTGLYRLQVADPYYRCVGADIKAISATSGAIVVDGGLSIGSPYMILGGTSGTPSVNNQPTTSTNWYTLGLYPGVNPAAGQVFVATSGASNVPGSSTSKLGQGYVAFVTPSTVRCEVMPSINTMLAPTSASSGVQGAIIQFMTLNSSNALASPAANSWLRWNLWLDNSTRNMYNESSTSN